MSKISIIIPAYNEEENLHRLMHQLIPVLLHYDETKDFELVRKIEEGYDIAYGSRFTDGGAGFICLHLCTDQLFWTKLVRFRIIVNNCIRSTNDRFLSIYN